MEEYLKKKAEILDSQKNSSAKTENKTQTQTQDKSSLPVESFHVLDENFHDLFLKRDGRLNRLRYFKRCMLVGLITNIPVQILTQMLLESSHDYFMALKVSIFLISVCGIASAYLGYGLMIRRSHDFPKGSFFADMVEEDDTKPAKILIGLALTSTVLCDLAGYFILTGGDSSAGFCIIVGILTSIPAAIIGLYFLFKGGEVGANKFGPDPLGPAVNKNDPRAYNPQNFQNTSEMNKSTKIFLGSAIVFIFVVVVGISSQDSSKNYTPSSNERTSDNSSYQRNQSSATPNSNSPSSTYNFQFNDNNGNSYNAVSNYREAFGIIQIDTSKEIYCNFDKNPRARGMFHNVRFAVSNGTNDPIFIGDVYLIDDRGRKYAEDINATTTQGTMMNFDAPSQINPGQAVLSFSIFDIPDNVNIVKVRYEEVFEQPIEVPYQVSKN